LFTLFSQRRPPPPEKRYAAVITTTCVGYSPQPFLRSAQLLLPLQMSESAIGFSGTFPLGHNDSFECFPFRIALLLSFFVHIRECAITAATPSNNPNLSTAAQF
jgi:hypothetical protein